MNDFKDPNKTMQRILDKHKLIFFGSRRFGGAGNMVSNNEGNTINNEGYKINNERIGDKIAKLLRNNKNISINKRYNNSRNNNDNNKYNPKKI
jgi:hypothetical protein